MVFAYKQKFTIKRFNGQPRYETDEVNLIRSYRGFKKIMNDCIFCKVINNELPSTKVFEDEDMLAINDIHPMAPTHVLLMPKKHFASLIEAKDEDEILLGKMLLKARDIAKEKGLDKSGYKIVINNGKDAGQLVYHLHVHILGGGVI